MGTLGNDEAAQYLGVTPSTLRTWVSKRRVPHVRVGRLVRFRLADLEKFLEAGAVPVRNMNGGNQG
ncbi:MAG: hypothetical protein CMJ45_02855 [Planctomyces sp.]|nr:hypothetical protein [Planctomyces sp.]